MDLSLSGSFRLFRAAGINVYLHWSWFLVALLQIQYRPDVYHWPGWKAAEYVALFTIVLLHEFGHALACRSVGGAADRIVLWPLGGIAYVAPPPRPGAVLWSIAAGPLVNVLLLPPLYGAYLLALSLGWRQSHPDVVTFLSWTAQGNLVLLLLNLLPIYPLDGGQIVQALLWFSLGRWRSLLVVSLVGMILGGALLLFSLLLVALAGELGALLLGFISLFIVLRSLASFQAARGILAVQALPRHAQMACPSCGIGPPWGPYWVCEHCQTRFDLFEQRGQCPACGAWYLHPICPHCYQKEHIDRWEREAPAGESREPG